MTEPQSIHAAQGPTAKGQGPTPINRSTGPNVVSTSSTKTPEGKRRCSLNAYRHGLTGQIVVKTPEEQQAYDQHCRIILEALAPATDFERLLAQSIADDRWRLNRARAIEDSTFAMGMHAQPAGSTGHPQVDDAFDQARTWAEQAHNLALLTVYEQRIQRSVDKNTAQLKALQTERKELARKAMEQAKMLYQLAEAQGKPYRPKAFFEAAPQVRESVFSAPEIARELSREKLLAGANRYRYNGELPVEN